MGLAEAFAEAPAFETAVFTFGVLFGAGVGFFFVAFLGLALFTGLGLFVDLIEGFAIGLLTFLMGLAALGRPLTLFAVMIIFTSRQLLWYVYKRECAVSLNFLAGWAERG